MAEITAQLVKELREKTGAGMMDCKKALGATSGDFEGAVDWLRKNGLAAAAKKASRVAAEGLVGVAVQGTKGAVVEVNAETDFVARNDKFQAFVTEAAKAALAAKDVDDLKGKLGDKLTNLIATIGENMNLRRMQTVSVGQGIVASYVHNQTAPGLGRIGVLVALESSGDKSKLEAFGRQVAMHVAAANPQSVDISGVDPEAVERERNVLTEQAQASGRPANIIAKMVEGRLRKFYEEVVLLEQTWVIDNESKVREVVEHAAKDAGAPVSVKAILRYALGEGIEREEKDFAAEVKATLGR
jgi:elongation factor Ts